MSAELATPASGDGLAELIAKARRPVAVDVRVDPVTLDRLFTLHFEDHPPIHVAVGALDLTAILADMHKVAASAMN